MDPLLLVLCEPVQPKLKRVYLPQFARNACNEMALSRDYSFPHLLPLSDSASLESCQHSSHLTSHQLRAKKCRGLEVLLTKLGPWDSLFRGLNLDATSWLYPWAIQPLYVHSDTERTTGLP